VSRTVVRRVRVPQGSTFPRSDDQRLSGELASLVASLSRTDVATMSEVAVKFDRATDLVIGTDEPNATNTGLVKPAALTAYTGPSTITTANTTIVDKIISTTIDVRASGFYMSNCLIIGPATTPTGQRFMISFDNVPSTGTRGIVEDVEIDPQVPSLWVTAFAGHHFRAKRIKIHNTVDFFSLRWPSTPTGVLDFQVLQSYGYDHSYFSPDPTHSDNQTHNDACQTQGGDGTGSLIRGNAFWGRRYSATAGSGNAPDRGTGTEDNGRYAQGSWVGVQYTDLSGYTTNLDVNDNWLRGYKRAMSAATANNVDVGRWYRNKIDDAQGERVSNSLSPGQGRAFAVDATTTLDAGESTVNKNVYLATTTGITAGTAAVIYRNQ
jgi:hypothetical protein